MIEFPQIEKNKHIALDFETNSTKYWDPDFRIIGASIAVEGYSQYWDLRHTPEVVAWLQDLIPGRLIIAQFAQFEIQCCRVLGIDPRSFKVYCTMTAECLIDEHHLTYDLYSIAGYHGIDSQKKVWLDRIAASLGVDSHSAALARIAEAPLDLVSGYGASDTSDAFSIWQKQQRHIEEQDLGRVLDLESRLTPVLADMSWHGVRVDLEAAHAAIPKLDEQEWQLQKEIDEIAGRKFNVNSTPQIRDFFQPTPINKFQWSLIDGTIVGPTKGGKGPSLDQKAMREIRHPLATKILALRKTIKLRDTFIRGHVIGSADQDGYVHTTFNQTRNDADAGTVTGRLSSTDPALQQITKRDKENAAILRAMFLPDSDERWLCTDYSQIDIRCGAHLQSDPGIIEAYQNNPALDYHQIVSDMTGIPRNAPYAGAANCKQINLGLSFGAGQGKLAFMMGMPVTIKEGFGGRMQYVAGPEAESIFNQYHKKLPAVKQFMKRAENVAKNTHYVRTMIGRRLRFPRGVGAHKAAGLLYQSYAADVHKAGLIATDQLIREKKLPARLMLSVHDEMGLSCPEDHEVGEMIRKTYTNFNSPDSPFGINLKIPVTASMKFADNWYLASKD